MGEQGMLESLPLLTQGHIGGARHVGNAPLLTQGHREGAGHTGYSPVIDPGGPLIHWRNKTS